MYLKNICDCMGTVQMVPLSTPFFFGWTIPLNPRDREVELIHEGEGCTRFKRRTRCGSKNMWSKEQTPLEKTRVYQLSFLVHSLLRHAAKNILFFLFALSLSFFCAPGASCQLEFVGGEVRGWSQIKRKQKSAGFLCVGLYT